MPSSEILSASDATAKAIRRCRLALWWTVVFLLFNLPFTYYDYTIYAFLPAPFYTWGPFVLFCLQIGTEIYSIYLLIRYFRTPRFRAFYPLLVVLTVHFSIQQTNPSDVNIKYYCSLFRDEREYVVSSYCNKSLRLEKGKCDECQVLPPKWKHLALENRTEISCDGDKQTALFFTNWGFLASWEALMYRSDDSYPDEPHILRASSIERLGKNWFYIVR